MLEICCEQKSDQWWAERLGKPSASNFDKILSPTGKATTQREGYLYELVAQRLSGKAEKDRYKSTAMEEGTLREDESRSLYELIYGVSVRQVGMIFPDEWKMYLCSPDGIIDGEQVDKPRGLEMKNVIQKTMVKYLLANQLPTDYVPQVQGSLLVTGFERWDFIAYCPGLKPLIIEVHRDEAYIKKLATELDSFNEDLLKLVEKLK